MSDTNATTETIEQVPEKHSVPESPKSDAERIQEAANPPAPGILEEDDQPYEPSDVFAWANNMYQYKDQLKYELFLINKNNVLYSTKLTPELEKQLQPLLLTNMLDFVLNGTAEGLVVRGFEEAEAEDNVLQRTRWKNVDKLAEVHAFSGSHTANR